MLEALRIGDWRLIRRVGIGGMGSVFEARHRRTGRRAAVKVLLPRLGRDPEFTARFLREAQVLARISHPEVVHAYDAGQDGDFYFIAMELVEGQDLQQLLEAEGCLSPARSTEVALAVARALGAIEQAGLVHRDVKPANILIDTGGAIKLADLGLFRDDLDSRVLWDGMVFGTPQYMSPEQVLGRDDIDIRSDLYSLGATWYHALIGRPPFTMDSPAAVAWAQVEALPAAPRDVRPGVPLEIDRLILALLEKDRTRRPSGPAAAARAIEAALASLEHRPPPLPQVSRQGGSPLAPASVRPGKTPARRVLGPVLWVGLVGLGALTLVWMGHRMGKEVQSPRPGAGWPSSGADLEVARETFVQALHSAQELSREVRDTCARVLLASLPRPSIFRGELSADPGPPDAFKQSAPAPSPSGVPAASRSALRFPEEVEVWAREGAALARARLVRILSGLEDRAILVMLRDGRPAIAKISASPPVLVGPDGTIPPAALHPAAVIAWAGLDPAEPLPDGGVGLALEEGFLEGARMVERALGPPLPAAVKSFLEEEAPEKLSGAAPAPAESFLERVLLDRVRERSAQAALREGRWEEALAVLEALLSPGEPSAIFGERRPEWLAWKARAERISYPSSRFFARPAPPVDFFRGEMLRIDYPFAAAGELADFRFDGRAWALRDGGLFARWNLRAGGKGAERKRAGFTGPLDTVALFAPPVAVEGRWGRGEEKGGRKGESLWIAVGYAGWFVAFGPSGDPVVWRGELGDGRLPPGGPAQEDPGDLRGDHFRVEFGVGAAIAELPRGRRMVIPLESAPALPPPGRVTIGLEPGGRLEELSITGTLDPVWAAERTAKLRNR